MPKRWGSVINGTLTTYKPKWLIMYEMDVRNDSLKNNSVDNLSENKMTF